MVSTMPRAQIIASSCIRSSTLHKHEMVVTQHQASVIRLASDKDTVFISRGRLHGTLERLGLDLLPVVYARCAFPPVP